MTVAKKGSLEMKKMRKQLMTLLNIHGVSGDETRVRDYLKPVLHNMMDSVVVDQYGNLLASKKIGSGRGATILLSAHMDTVRGVKADRTVLESNGVITSDKGALGADDRAGIAIILQVLRSVEFTGFEGTIKVAFSREEEIGCVGASRIDKNWYADVDLAIIVDRMGNRDIVVGNFELPFCSDNVGDFMENVSALQGMNWECVEGGVSDAMVFAENGINAINLSAGYMNEHTEKEYVVFNDMKKTVKLIIQTFAVVNDFVDGFGSVPKENKWILPYYSYSNSQRQYVSSYPFEDQLDISEFTYAETSDNNGDVYVYEMGRDIAITQNGNEIILSRNSLKSLMQQLKDTL